MNQGFSQMSTPPSGPPPGYGGPPPGYGGPPPGYGGPPPGYGGPPPGYGGPPPGYGGPPPGYGGPPPGYMMPPAPWQNNTAKIVLIVLAAVFGGGIFIIAILAAILFPVFQKVRGNARLASCSSNVKQIELGMVQYTQDKDGKFPPKSAAYKDAVFPYIQSESVFHCPADQGGPVDYSMNTNLQGVSLDKIPHPAEVVAIYEGKDQKPDFRHDGKAVIGYADGHVEELTEAQASGLQWKL